LSVGGDGVLYKMLDSRDWNRYHVLSEEEMQNEVRRSREVKENMYTMMGKLKNGQYTSRSKPGPKFMPPQLGTASRTKKIDQRAWEKDLTLAMSGEATTRGHSNSSYNKTIASLIDNTRENEDDEEDTPPSPVYDYSQSVGPDKVTKAFHVIKTKYEQNLHVVDKLYHEKMSLEEYTNALEEELMRAKGVESPTELQQMLRLSRQLTEPEYEDDFPEGAIHGESLHNSVVRGGPKGSSYDPMYSSSRGKENLRNGEESYTLEEMAALLHPGDQQQGYNHRLGRSLDRGGHTMRSSSAPRNMMKKSNGGNLNATTPARASSVGRSRSGSRPRSEGLSASLQADCDRFVQKRRIMDERDRLAKLEQEKYELEMQDKKLRASKNPKEFTEMFQRQELMKLKQQKRAEDQKRKEKEEELRAKKEKHKKQIEKMTLMNEAFRGHMSWKEIQDTEEAQRRERIEKRKNELLTQAALPRSIEENMSKSLSKIPPPSYDEAVKPFKAEDPKKVIQKIERRRQEWEETMTQQKLKIKEQHEAARLQSGGSGSLTSTTKTTMEIRFEEYQKKNEERAKRHQEKEEAERRKKEAEERRKREKLLNMKMPEASKKTTKKAEVQAQLTRDRQLKEEEEAKKQRDKMRKKDLAMKETSAALSVVIKEEEQRLKSNNPNYLELSKSEHVAEEKAKQAREEYRQKLRDNKLKLKESLKSRPSLIERHEKNIATRDASTAALRKVATAVMSAGGGRRDEGKDDDDDDDDDGAYGGALSSRSKRSNGSSGKPAGEDFLDEIFNPVQKMSLGRKP
jgi:hypothetical protein